MTDYVTWHGASGKTYSMELHEIGTAFSAVPGVYIFCTPGTMAGRWAQKYVGECESFKERLSDNLENHHRWDCIKRERATHICVMQVNGGKQARLIVETDLRKRLDPPCNRQ